MSRLYEAFCDLAKAHAERQAAFDAGYLQVAELAINESLINLLKAKRQIENGNVSDVRALIAQAMEILEEV